MRTAQSMLRSACAFLACGLLAACASNRVVPENVAVAPTTSVAQADQRLADVAAERAAIEARYAAREAACYDKFFVNSCLDEAKERRRTALAAQDAIEVEAEYFKRKNKVEERDRAMAQAAADYAAEEARAGTQPPAAPKDIAPVPPARPTAVAKRMAERKARLQKEAAAAPAEAAKRAANAAAFDGRRRKSEERQRVVAERKAQREAKRAAKAAEEKAAAEKAAAQKAAEATR